MAAKTRCTLLTGQAGRWIQTILKELLAGWQEKISTSSTANYLWLDNPYFTAYENTNGFDKNRVLSNASVTVCFY
ncbi:MAG: hypothetical protein WKF59_10365 [Chitinophagaceae bacterium]